ncbi:MAG: pentapeptide repeat-containing protein [Candidatus Atribacteria bacterium]|nr:MAG: pentapeptide repeat-containing protein [Candidatus Atribacteria bacterium]
MGTEKQLKERWLTADGKKTKQRVIRYINEDNWERFLKGFPFVEEIRNRRDLRYINIENLNLDNSNFNYANLIGAKFIGTSLDGSIFSNAKMQKIEMLDSYLVNCNFFYANIQNSKLINSDFSKSEFAGAILKNSKLDNSTFNEADLSGVNLRNSSLINVKMYDTNLEDAILIGSDFKNAHLDRSNLSGTNSRNTCFENASMNDCWILFANLRNTNLNNAYLHNAKLNYSYLNNSNLTITNLESSDLSCVTFKKASLIETNLTSCNLNEVDLSDAKLINCNIYGVSTWKLETNHNTIMKDLIITKVHPDGKLPKITTNDLEIAQFLYLIINNKKIKNVIDRMRTHCVLILGSFSEDKTDGICPKVVLEKIKEILPRYNFIPIVFDFDPSKKLDFLSTVKTLALLSSFVIVDLSIAAGQLIELGNLVQVTPVPFIPIISNTTKHVTSMIQSFRNYPWFRENLLIYSLENYDVILPKLIENDIIPWAQNKNKELEKERKN